jgi:hypothetical protein
MIYDLPDFWASLPVSHLGAASAESYGRDRFGKKRYLASRAVCSASKRDMSDIMIVEISDEFAESTDGFLRLMYEANHGSGPRRLFATFE